MFTRIVWVGAFTTVSDARDGRQVDDRVAARHGRFGERGGVEHVALHASGQVGVIWLIGEAGERVALEGVVDDDLVVLDQMRPGAWTR